MLQVNKITLCKIENFLLKLKKLIYILSIAFFATLLISNQTVNAQNSGNEVSKKDTSTTKLSLSKKKKGDISTTVKYDAVDSIRFDAANSIVKLYGNAKINYGEIKLTAERIEINWLKNEVVAEGAFDSTGKEYGTPLFEEGKDKYSAHKIKYNFKTKKGLINGVITQQGEGYIHGTNIKKNESNEMFVDHARYTTCNHANPHFWIDASKIKVIPGKKFVSGPFNLMIEGMRTPLVFPLGFFPVQNKRSSGIIFPQYGQSNVNGFYLQQGGYYWAVNDYIGAKFIGDLYTNGGYRVYPFFEYVKRYHYSGNLNINYSSLTNGFGARKEQLPKSIWITWNHKQTSKKNSSLSASVNAGSSGFMANNTMNTNQYITNTFNSSVNYSKSLGNSPFSIGIVARHDQNVRTNIMNFVLPSFGLNMNRVSPFAKIRSNSASISWIKSLAISFNFNTSVNMTNYVSQAIKLGKFSLDAPTYRKADTMTINNHGIEMMLKNATIYGSSSIPISTTIKLLKYFSLNPTFTLNTNFNTRRLKYSSPVSGVLNIDTLNQISGSYYYNFSTNLTTRLYSSLYLKTNKIEAIRLVSIPTVSYVFTPELTGNGFTKVFYTTAKDKYESFSNFQGIGPVPLSGKRSQILNFSLSNTLEGKFKQKTDTAINYKKVMLLDNISMGGSYNITADSFKLSLIGLNARTVLFGKFNVNVTSTFDPYKYTPLSEKNSYNETMKRVDVILPINKFKFINLNVSVSTSLNQDAFKSQRAQDLQMSPDLVAFYNANPHLRYVDFSIPWNVTLNYNLNWNKNMLTTLSKQTAQTATVNGNFNLSEKFKVDFATGYDFLTKKVSLGATRLAIVRDLHCWQMNMSWSPFSRYQTYIVNINVKASSLQDLKITKRSMGRAY